MMKWNGIFKRFFGKGDSAPETAPSPQTAPAEAEPERVRMPDYKDPRYLELAGQCAMGDIRAMMDLARWHRRQILPEGERLLAAYEADQEQWDPLAEWFRKKSGRSDCVPLQYYITWVYRASLYGSPEAEALVERCGRYRDAALIPRKFYESKPYCSHRIWGYGLNRLGFLDVDRSMDDFNLYNLTEDGIYPAYFLADYIPADSDGFGREDDYEDIFYDEFFNHLPGKKLSEARVSLAVMKKKRELYWADPAHDREHRMYKRLLSEG